MLALSKVLRRGQRLPLGACNTVCSKLEIQLDGRNNVLESQAVTSENSQAFPRFYGFPLNHSTNRHAFSSKADTESGGEEDDPEDEFSDLEIAESTQAVSSPDEIGDVLISEEELSGSEDDVEAAVDELDLADPEQSKKTVMMRSELFRAIASVSGLSVGDAIDKWVADGKELTRGHISSAMVNLRKRRMYGRALQMVEWLEANKKTELTEKDYASKIDLIAKIRGLQKAEANLEKIPKSFRGEHVYRTLLANAVATSNLKKSEEIFNKMKDLGFPLTSFTCDQLIILYKRVDKKKIADVLLLMEKENVKPTIVTYNNLIDTKGQSNDIDGMEQIMETMQAEGIELDIYTQSIIARHYATAGMKEKAEKVLKDMEGGSLTSNRWACKDLLSVYGFLGKEDEVNRIWKICEEKPRLDESLSAIIAFGKLGKVEKAEEIFEKTLKMSSRVTSNIYSVLLRVYGDHKMVSKGKELVKRMGESGCQIGALTCDSLVRLYVGAGEVEKAASLLKKAAQQNRLRPLMSSFMCIMDEYAKRGDVHNTEKIFVQMRQAGYVSRLRQFQALLQVYVNAKAPAYGMRERMKADNVFPNKSLAALLSRADPFKKTAVSELLD